MQEVQTALIALLEPLAERDLTWQFHPDLSPLGWHVGHCLFVEAYWLSRRGGGRAPSAKMSSLYAADSLLKPLRGPRLPTKAALLHWASTQQRRHLTLLAALPHQQQPTDALADLPRFLLQHHAQHLETMQMVLAQRAATLPASTAAARPLEPQPVARDAVLLPAGEYSLGCKHSLAYDNEQPPRTVRLPATRLNRHPVRNAEYLGFMVDAGYQRPEFWSEHGWRWQQANAVRQPEHWRQTAGGGWLLLAPNGPAPLQADDTLIGINHFEAEAFACWAGARLPHEYEWEAAAASALLEGIGTAWEWSGNRFHPYPGFRAFPYDGYSLSWFDGGHYVLRGGSRHTLPCIRRRSFRNFYTADKRHIFAGCRLVFEE